MLSLQAHESWKIVRRISNAIVLPTRFVFNRKKNAEGVVCRHKARLVVKGFMQGDIERTFAPVVDFNTVRIVLTVAIWKGFQIEQLDVRTAFLHGDIDEDIFVSPPPGLNICSRSGVLRLQKGLYGLKQAPRLWNDKWNAAMDSLGLLAVLADPCVFVNGDIWPLLYVDDVLIIGPDEASIATVKKNIVAQFDVEDLGRPRFFLGIEFIRQREVSYLSQRGYILQTLKRIGMDSSESVSTPMSTVLDRAGSRDEPTDKLRFQEIIGCLLFISTRTKPDICAAVGLLCRYVAEPRSSHLVATKRILRYLKGTQGYSLQLKPSSTELIAYADHRRLA